jgi:MFS-type transporter involved in bile tolerance (Atg22 family)
MAGVCKVKSLHRLVAIVVIWIAVILVSFTLFNATMMAGLSAPLAAIIYMILFASAGAGTWAIARSKTTT